MGNTCVLTSFLIGNTMRSMKTPLARYFQSRKQTDSPGALAQRMGVSRTTVWRWATGRRLPDVVEAFALQRETGGKVRAADWPSTARTA